jgi:hypothetical protein
MYKGGDKNDIQRAKKLKGLFTLNPSQTGHLSSGSFYSGIPEVSAGYADQATHVIPTTGFRDLRRHLYPRSANREVNREINKGVSDYFSPKFEYVKQAASTANRDILRQTELNKSAANFAPVVKAIGEEVKKEAAADHPLVSSNIKAVGYDKKEKELEIAFHSGGEYKYKDVPRGLYARLLKVKSPGKFFHKHIKKNNKFEFEKEDNTAKE